MVGISDKKQPKTQPSTELCIISINLNTFSGFTTSVGQVHCNFLLGRWKLVMEHHRSITTPLVCSAGGAREGEAWEYNLLTSQVILCITLLFHT